MNAVTLMIKSFFEKNEWRYSLEESEEDNNDKIDTFRTGFNLKNEGIDLNIRIFRGREMYQIIGFPRDSRIPVTSIQGGLIAVNEFNLRSSLACAFLDREDGCLGFFKGTNTDGLTFSEEVFNADLNAIFHAVDYETAQIVKNAIKYDPIMEPPKKGFFSRFRKE